MKRTKFVAGGGGGVTKITILALNDLLYTHWSEFWSLKCELLIILVGRGWRGFWVKLLPGQKKKKKPTIMHKIRTLFLSRNITRLVRWRGWQRLRASPHRSAIKLDFSISRDKNSALILCIIVVAVFLARVVICSFCWASANFLRWPQRYLKDENRPKYVRIPLVFS